MSFDVFAFAFKNGDAGVADADAIRAVLAPFVSEVDEFGFARVVTNDGDAEVQGFGSLESGFTMTRISGLDSWNLLVRAAAASNLVIAPPGCPVALTDRSSIEDLPEDLLAYELAVVSTGRQLLDLIQGRAWACPVCFEPLLTSRPYAKWPPSDVRTIVPPYEDALGLPSYEVCPTCQFEFGNDDNPGTAEPISFAAYRAEWKAP